MKLIARVIVGKVTSGKSDELLDLINKDIVHEACVRVKM